MRAVGLVVEYNPLHNGHLYHLQAARQRSGAEVVVAVMSGNFCSAVNRRSSINGRGHRRH